MRHSFILTFCLVQTLLWTRLLAQDNPGITSWLQNTTKTGSYYNSGSSTAIDNKILVNCQKVEYSASFVYVHTKGVPAYPTGPFQDGNPSQASNQNAIFKFPLSPAKGTGTPTKTTGGNIGVFINGVALFDYRDGVAWNASTGSLCGGPGNPPCPGGPGAEMSWNRDAIVAERAGFDCSKGHPAQGNYHHHQNPSAFKLDINVISTICNLYDADGLYVIDPAKHSPLIGFAYDGFPIYGAYGYKNADGTGGITRIKSSYALRSITTRTNWADGTDVEDGPAVSATYPLGYFREDYAYTPTSASTPDYLDEHNGRFCITPEYPKGTYAYFCTVDANHNSAYPYAVGPTFYGVYANRKVTSVSEATTVYTPVSSFLKAAPASISIPAEANKLGIVEVTSNVAWTAKSDQSWLTLSTTSGSNNASITLTAAANTTSTSRSATVTVEAAGLASQLVKITQADAKTFFLTLSTDTMTVEAAKSTNSFSLNSNTTWKLSTSADWLKLSSNSGKDNATIGLEIAANTTDKIRFATIKAEGDGFTAKSLIVKQLASVPTGLGDFGKTPTINIAPNPAQDLIGIQIVDLVREDLRVQLYDAIGRELQSSHIYKGQTIAYFDVQTLYNGLYFVRISNNSFSKTMKVQIER